MTFREDFEGWTENLFRFVQTDDLKDLRNHLRQYGVFVPMEGHRIAKELAKVIEDDEYHVWTTEEVEKQLDINTYFVSR